MTIIYCRMFLYSGEYFHRKGVFFCYEVFFYINFIELLQSLNLVTVDLIKKHLFVPSTYVMGLSRFEIPRPEHVREAEYHNPP